MTLAIGIDIGGYVKFSGNNIQLELPNIVGSADSVSWSDITINKSWETNLVLIEEGKEHFIGELARTQSEIKRFLIDQGTLTRIVDVFLVIKAALPLIMKNNDEIDIVLGIGVPISTSEEKMKELSSKLKGEFIVKIQNEVTKEIIERKFNIKQVFLMPESYGTYYNILTKVGEEDVVDAIVISLDLHTEIITIYDGNLIRKASRNLANASLSVLTNKVALALEEDTRAIVSPHSILENIRTNNDQIVIGGRIINIGKVKEFYIRQISTEIVDNIIEVLKLLPPESNIEYFILTGEACEIFWSEIEMLIIENHLIKDYDVDKVIKVPDPIFSNSIGFEKIMKKRIASSD